MGNLERGDIFLVISWLANLQLDLGTISLFLPCHTSISCRFNGQTPSLMTPVQNDNSYRCSCGKNFTLHWPLFKNADNKV